jgi:arylsulfatase A-like enzyme
VTGVPETWLVGLPAAAGVALAVTLALLVKSVKDFSHAGPQVRGVIRDQYRLYVVWAVGRLALWAFLVTLVLACGGLVALAGLAALMDYQPGVPGAALASAAGVAAGVLLQFSEHLFSRPGSIAASSHYRMSRFYGLWRLLSPVRLAWARGLLALVFAASVAAGLVSLAAQGRWADLLWLLAPAATLVAGVLLATWEHEPRPVRATGRGERMNLLMVGCDTLRADRLGLEGYRRELTPCIDRLARRGTYLRNCYVPIPRTAPSLTSLLTGTWPATHGVRDNFVGDDQRFLSVPRLPETLARAGYRTVAVSDWSGSDFGKFNLGFQELDLPEDQWNLKYLLRQGPKDLRLYLSLFTHNRFGRRFLPEIYYLAGVPLARDCVRQARRWLSRFAGTGEPFMLNVFVAAAHPPFGSEHPYYTLYADPAYKGESKFAMARLTDPMEIIRAQREPKEAFDLDQVIDLYDGSVRSFDDQLAELVQHLESCGLADNTLIVVYSDHGMEFFEQNTWGQGNSVLSDHSPRVPLLVCDPRYPQGSVFAGVSRSIDVAPTLLDLLGLERPSGMDGISLVPYLRGGAGDPGLAAYCETGIWLTPPPGMPEDHLRYPELLAILEVPDTATGTLALKPAYRQIVLHAKDRMVRRGDWKLVYQPCSGHGLVSLLGLGGGSAPGPQPPPTGEQVARDLITVVNGFLAEDGARAVSWAELAGPARQHGARS